tara:strand:- start:35 stop:259 length:225 start_codon:yes stop_codon:yes gene_type:complete
MKAGLLTVTQKDELVGQEFALDSHYNPVQDCNDKWIISTQEIEQTVYPTFYWVKSIPLIDYCPKIYPPINPPLV